MPVTDPRERYDDLLERESHELLDPEEFEEAKNSEAAESGWVAFALAFDDEGRVLLLDEAWADGWTLPGGTREPGEALPETVAREVREETGVAVTPVRPHSVEELTFENEATGDTDGWTGVLYEARAETTAVREDLGHDNHETEEIAEARWFVDLPGNVFNPEVIREVYRRCVADDGPA
jgi:8-oxo-dGTP pyrophosphatase MutT (NUDIX family)